MSPGSAGTAGDRFRVEKPVGRHRAPPTPPTPPTPDRFTVPIAAGAAILTAASLIALYAPNLAPDARAAGEEGATVSTAARTARTVHVPLTILPATPPSIGASGAWDPETDAPIPVTTPSAPARAPRAVPTGTRSAPTPSEAPQEPLVATTAPLTPDQQPATQPEATTTAPPAETAAATTTSSATPSEEPTMTAEPTPTDIGDAIDQALEDAGR